MLGTQPVYISEDDSAFFGACFCFRVFIFVWGRACSNVDGKQNPRVLALRLLPSGYWYIPPVRNRYLSAFHFHVIRNLDVTFESLLPAAHAQWFAQVT